METYTPIKDFEQTKGNISSAWLRSHKGMNHLIGFVSPREGHVM